jgi:hypothetical protein
MHPVDQPAYLIPVWWDDTYVIARLGGLFFVNFNCYKRKAPGSDVYCRLGRIAGKVVLLRSLEGALRWLEKYKAEHPE